MAGGDVAEIGGFDVDGADEAMEHGELEISGDKGHGDVNPRVEKV